MKKEVVTRAKYYEAIESELADKLLYKEDYKDVISFLRRDAGILNIPDEEETKWVSEILH